MRRGGEILGAVAVLVGLATGAAEAQPFYWDIDGHREYLDVAKDDPWCRHVRAIRDSVDTAGGGVSADAREIALAEVRAEADTAKEGDILWPFRKALICGFIDIADLAAEASDWRKVDHMLRRARLAARNQPDETTLKPLVPIYDHLLGRAPKSLEPVDLSTKTYCGALETANLALSQYRGQVVQSVLFAGGLRRAPDWFGLVQTSYQDWAREHFDRRQAYRDDRIGRGVPFLCQRFHGVWLGSKEYAVKDNLIFLLPERDDPNKAGRLVIEDAEGNTVVLDRILAAAQLNSDGTGSEALDLFKEDVAASPVLSGAVERADSVPAPETFQILFGSNEVSPAPGDPEVVKLEQALAARGPEEPIRIALTGHTDCVGSRAYNLRLSRMRVDTVFNTVIAPALVARGLSEDDLRNRDRLKVVGVGAFAKTAFGETAPLRSSSGGCSADGLERRVSVVLQ